jgi:hypothetical protein
MPERRFELREVDWSPARVAAVALMLFVAIAHFTLATTTGQLRFAVLALGLLVGFVVFFTDLWRPLYNLVGAAYVVVMAGVWLLSGSPMPVLGFTDVVAKAALFAVFVYLLAVERRGVEEGESGA